MKIKSLYISSFGKIKNYSLSLGDGINTIIENNGWGKSTLSAFIKAMFYGLNDTKRNILDNERTKFRSWNSTETFGGNIVFTWKDSEYKIERFFGSKASEDTVKLFDNVTGKEYSKTENLGQRIFQIDEEGFCSTTYFSQKDLEVKTNSSLTQKYSSSNESEFVDEVDKYIQKLENKAKEYKQLRGDKGLISDVKKEIFSVNAQIEEASKAKETIESLKAQINDCEKECFALKNEVDDLNEQIIKNAKSQALKVKKDRLLKIESEIANKNKEIDKLNEILLGNRVSEEEIKICNSCVSDLNKFSGVKTVLENDVNILTGTDLQFNKNKKVNLFMYAGIIAVLLGVGLMFVNLIAGIASIVIGAILGVIFLVKRNNYKGVNNSYINEKQMEIDKYSSLILETENKLNNFFSKFNVGDRGSYLSKVSLLEQTELKMSFTLRDLKALTVEKNNLIADGVLEGEVEFCDERVLSQNFENAKYFYSKKASELSNLKAKLANYTLLYDSFGDLENDKQLLEEKLTDYVRHYDILTLTLRFFKEADENMKIKYKRPLQDAFLKYYKEISGNENTSIDIDFNVSVDEDGHSRSTDFYSVGYRNLFNVCKRFALIDVLYADEKPFIILDDPFVNLDEDKLFAMKEVLKKLEKHYQILYFACHESREIK